jgi:membrane protein implicated in regulation of membrane protease activity
MPATRVPATAPATRGARRTPAVRALFCLLIFQALGAMLGGGMLMAQFGGGAEWFPAEWLDDIPFDSWLWPGLILGVGLGVSALALAYGLRRTPRWRVFAFIDRVTGHHWSWAGSVGLGIGLMAWIVVQRLLIPGTTWLQPFYFAVGAAITALALTPGVRRHLRHRPRAGPRSAARGRSSGLTFDHLCPSQAHESAAHPVSPPS